MYCLKCEEPCEFRLKKTAVIPVHLRRCRVRAYTGMALHAAPPHLNRTCLVFSNPSADGNEIRTARHATHSHIHAVLPF